jgi:hypothetical protein
VAALRQNGTDATGSHVRFVRFASNRDCDPVAVFSSTAAGFADIPAAEAWLSERAEIG